MKSFQIEFGRGNDLNRIDVRCRRFLGHALSAVAFGVWLFLSGLVCAQEFSDNVVIVLDASGSMRDVLAGTSMRKMDAAKKALKSVLSKVPESTQLGLLVFSAAGLKDHWVYPLGARDDEALTKAIDRIEPSGDTPLGKYIKIGADRLLEARAKQFGYGSYRLLVVTDGEAQDRPLVDRFTPDVMSRGITMDVIGVGMSQDHTLATRVHSYRRANDPEALSRAVTEVFAEMGGNASDVAVAESFELIQPLPNEVAASMIQALSLSGNHPIGSKPSGQATTTGSAAQEASPPRPTPRPPQPLPPAPAERKSYTFWIILGTAVLVILMKSKGRR